VFTVDYEKQDGNSRTLIGHLIGSEPKMGRSQVRDLEITSGYNTRLVDHRTISSITLKGTKYIVK